MRVNTKDKIDEDLRKLVGDLKEEPKKDTTHIEIRRERNAEAGTRTVSQDI